LVSMCRLHPVLLKRAPETVHQPCAQQTFARMATAVARLVRNAVPAQRRSVHQLCAQRTFARMAATVVRLTRNVVPAQRRCVRKKLRKTLLSTYRIW